MVVEVEAVLRAVVQFVAMTEVACSHYRKHLLPLASIPVMPPIGSVSAAPFVGSTRGPSYGAGSRASTTLLRSATGHHEIRAAKIGQPVWGHNAPYEEAVGVARHEEVTRASVGVGMQASLCRRVLGFADDQPFQVRAPRQ